MALDGAFAESGGKGVGLRFELAMGQPFVKTEPRDGTTALWVEAPCRFVVLPDFFADDIVIDAAELSVARAELPSENFLLHLLPERDAIVMTVASNRTQDAQYRVGLPAARKRRFDIRGHQWPGRRADQPQPDVLRPGRQDLGRRAPRREHLARLRRGQGAGGQGDGPGLEGAVCGPVARRLAAGQ